MGKKQCFQVFHLSSGEATAVIEMDEDLLAPDAGILDLNTKTLRSFKNGAQYTLIPVDGPVVSTLRRVRDVYKAVTDTPAKLFSTSVSRMDELILAVGLMFGEIKIKVVENRDDMDKIINPPRGTDYEPKIKVYKVLGELLADAEGEHGPNCGEGCSHTKKENDE